MTEAAPPARAAPNGLGALLRHWRDRRGRSQLDLSLDTGLSQRHISFVESGRSQPSRRTLTVMAEALDVPLRERNALLLAAGYAPVYAETPWDAPEMQAITGAIRRMLRQHEPFPAIVMDRHWNVLLTNAAAPAFFGRYIDMAARPRPGNLLRLVFDPRGLRPFIAKWEEVAAGLIGRVSREAVGRAVDETTEALLAELLAYPGVKPAWRAPEAPSGLPVIPLSFHHDGGTLNYFSMITTVGTPQTVVAQELRIECLFPADDATELRHPVGRGAGDRHLDDGSPARPVESRAARSSSARR